MPDHSLAVLKGAIVRSSRSADEGQRGGLKGSLIRRRRFKEGEGREVSSLIVGIVGSTEGSIPRLGRFNYLLREGKKRETSDGEMRASREKRRKKGGEEP